MPAADSSRLLCRCSFCFESVRQQHLKNDHLIVYLNLALERRSSLEVALSDTLGNAKPKLPAFPLALFFDGRNCDLFLGRRDVMKYCTRMRIFRSRVPRPLNHVRGSGNVRRRGQRCLECV